MGPIAGIGDSMIPGMLIPILLSIGMALAAGGNILGPLFYTVAWLAIIIPGSWFLFLKGYQMGSGSVEMLVSSKSTRLREALSLLGVFVMGGVAASYVKLGTGLEFITRDGVNIHVQQMLDGIFPQLLPLAVVLGTWYLMAKRGVSCGKSHDIAAYTCSAWRGVRFVCRIRKPGQCPGFFMDGSYSTVL